MTRRSVCFLMLLACGDTPTQLGPDASDASLDIPNIPNEVGPLDATLDASDEPDVDAFQCGTIVPTGSVATNFQINARHDGVQPSDHLALPLCKRWTVPFNGPISYPIVASGRVFVTVADLDAGGGTNVYALDQKNGALLWGPLTLTSFQSWSALTYDNGRLFVLDNRGVLTALDPATGSKIWQAKSPATFVNSAPTAWGGRIYFSGGAVYAYDELDGTLGWMTTGVLQGGDATPAIDITGVYLGYDCDQIYSFDPGSGTQKWVHSGGCSGGTGNATALRGGTLFARDYLSGDLVLIASSGVATASFAPPQSSPPALSFIGADTLLRVLNGSMDAWQFTQQATLWSFAGDGKLVTAPLVASSTVIIGSTAGNLYAVDAASGTLVSSDDVGYPLEYRESASGLAIADGMLFVPAKGALVAY